MSIIDPRVVHHVAQTVDVGGRLGEIARDAVLSETAKRATASTGAAIAGLSGAAAEKATKAFLGGGTIADGGRGIAGGEALLSLVEKGPKVALVVVGAGLIATAGVLEIRDRRRKARAKAAEDESPEGPITA